MASKKGIETLLLKHVMGAPSKYQNSSDGTAFKKGLKKASKFGLSCLGLGAFDALHPKSIDSLATRAGKWLGKYIPGALQFIFPVSTQLYQLGLMSTDFGAGVATLYDKKASKKENLANLITGPANAVGMDYSSASIAAGKPVYPLPKADYGWRINAFKHTMYGSLAKLVNTPSFIPGLLTGYVLGVYSLAAYAVLKTAFWLYKNAPRVKAWMKKTSANLYSSLDKSWKFYKTKIENGYTYLTNRCKSAYARLSAGANKLTRGIDNALQSIKPSRTLQAYMDIPTL
ncbi:MAG: hypothetical protein M1348_03125 [Candidatus Parvarchaeota archaeon]|jgi:hypothetical protein|nr:hypothetical protein [Candidatus Parvarchaeota archaeon]MCL5101576.1 hypothetical protein [Candidatus Parvarchaeota archaeon]